MTYLSDKEQAQFLKDLWKKYGTTILLAIVVFMTVNFSWRYWQQYKTQQYERSSIIFSQLMNAKAQNKKNEVDLFAANLMKNFAHSVYAGFAAMVLAKDAVNNHNYIEAKANLNWVIHHSWKKELSELAKVRLARVLIDDNNPQEAINLLQADTNKLYLSAKYEVMGDALIAQNKAQDALGFYQKALTLSTTAASKEKNTLLSSPTSPMLQLKAEQLGM
jgi:predicted negative regulator of RcsB-dependent stress response